MKSKSKPTQKLNPQADSSPAPANAKDLAAVVAKAEKIIALESDLTAAELRATEIKQALMSVQTVELPELMASLGLKEFSLKNGAKVSIKPIVSASIPTESAIAKTRDQGERDDLQARFDQAMAYLAENGAASLIKNLVYVELGKDSVKLVAKAKAALKKAGFTPVAERGVHAQTLTAWVKERLEGGHAVDMDLLHVYSGSKAVIVAPKGTKPVKSIF